MSKKDIIGIKDVFVDDHADTLVLRQKQMDGIEELPYPKLAKINLDKYQYDEVNVTFNKEKKQSTLPEDLKPFIEDDTNIIVLKDGNIIYQNLDEAFSNIKLMSYFDALEQNDQRAIDYLTKDLQEDAEDKLTAINRSYRNSGLFIEVPKNTSVKETLKIHIIGSRDLIHRTVLVANSSSNLTILEKIDNLNPIKANITSFTEVLDNAHINYLGIDRLCENTVAYIKREANVYRDAHLVYALGQLNDGHTVATNHVRLLGENANCESRNVLLSDKQSVHAVTVHIEHFAKHSIGNIINHGIVKDQAYLHIDGIGKIHKGMNASNAQQETHVITLSDDAKVDANPYLLIDEYDVFAGHGAGIGQVDQEQLYYMMSRGMSKREAEKLIILGFLYPIIEMIDSDLIKTDFVQTIEKKLSI